MNDKINIGEVTIAEYNLLMKQLAMGQLGECIELFMRLRQLGVDYQQRASGQPVSVPPPPTERT